MAVKRCECTHPESVHDPDEGCRAEDCDCLEFVEAEEQSDDSSEKDDDAESE